VHPFRTAAAIAVICPEASQFVPFHCMIPAFTSPHKPFIYNVYLENLQLLFGQAIQPLGYHLLRYSRGRLLQLMLNKEIKCFFVKERIVEILSPIHPVPPFAGLTNFMAIL
jgi:hypothetical protein